MDATCQVKRPSFRNPHRTSLLIVSHTARGGDGLHRAIANQTTTTVLDSTTTALAATTTALAATTTAASRATGSLPSGLSIAVIIGMSIGVVSLVAGIPGTLMALRELREKRALRRETAMEESFVDIPWRASGPFPDERKKSWDQFKARQFRGRYGADIGLKIMSV
jgi:hypothetical protein